MQAAGLASIFCKNTAEFPPHPPSAVFLRGRTEFLAEIFGMVGILMNIKKTKN